MTTDPALVEALLAHWAGRADLGFVRADLARKGLTPERLGVADLAPYDQLHAGQLRATRAFAAWADVPDGARVLDLGAGLGGAARYLAHAHGCRVTAVELSPALHEAGAELTRWVGLTDRVDHRCLDLLDLPAEAAHDLIWIQHVDMHVEDKAALYAGCRAQLAPAGRVVWHDWLAGPGGALHYPVPWARGDDLSFLISEQALRAALASVGLALTRLEDVTALTRTWFDDTANGLRHVLGKLADRPGDARRRRFEPLLAAAENVLRNLDERRLVPIFAEAAARDSGPANDPG